MAAIKFSLLDIRAPLQVDIEITHRCNSTCVYCFSDSGPYNTSEMHFETFGQLLQELKQLSVFDICISGGEPFIHKDIINMIEAVQKAGIGLVIVSNGTLISKEIAKILNTLMMLHNVQISFDGHNRDIHNKTRMHFDKALTGFLNMCEEAGSELLSPSVGIVLTKHNYRHVLDTITFFKSYTNRINVMGIKRHPDLCLSKEEAIDFSEKYLPLIRDIADSSNLQITLFDKPVGDFATVNTHINCLGGLTFLVIACDLNIYPCSMARTSFGKWDGIGSLERIFHNSKLAWKNLNAPWCEVLTQ